MVATHGKGTHHKRGLFLGESDDVSHADDDKSLPAEDVGVEAKVVLGDVSAIGREVVSVSGYDKEKNRSVRAHGGRERGVGGTERNHRNKNYYKN